MGKLLFTAAVALILSIVLSSCVIVEKVVLSLPSALLAQYNEEQTSIVVGESGDYPSGESEGEDEVSPSEQEGAKSWNIRYTCRSGATRGPSEILQASQELEPR